MADSNNPSEAGETGEAVGTGNDARIAMLNQIADGNDTSRADELRNVNDDESTEEFKVEAENGAGAEEEKPPAEESGVVTEEPPPEQPAAKHKIKVNGQEVELTYEELIASAQKVTSADAYLAEAAKLRNDAIRATQSQPPAKAGADALEDEVALARAIQMGTEEEAVAALRKIRTKGPSQDDIARIVDERNSFDRALSTFRQEYSDIAGDPVLDHWAKEIDKELIAQGDRRPYLERYRDVGTRIRSWKEGVVKASVTDASLQKKEERKASAPAVPRQAAGKTETSVVEEKEESTSDVIASMAAKRGGPQWMQGRS